ncbi:NAD(P)H-quinone oxidoreductase [Ochrobactrum sp. Q0168]|uniref:NAD(P)H-quinone oxidoreductase n=1 Tax=Ochrobactrum sp. Q0168 TaxID=2793241 RepID=UPI0018ED1D32|nr:NAD(P)H-quinone oxidoreductase [Ochrobactrum sp. Q0168]
MRAIRCPAPGGPEALKLLTVPVPRPGRGQVLIQVHAAGVNRPDISQRRGVYPVPADADPTLGLEVAGTIAAVGEDVPMGIGERVCSLVHGGGYADFAIAEADQLIPLPDSIDFVIAAALPEVAMTVEYNLIERAALKKGEWVLIHGGSSGIGSHAIQRAKTVGARVIVTAGSVAKCDYCRSLGAEIAINYREIDFVEAVLQATGGRGVNVVLDMVGGDYVDRNLQAMTVDGRCAIISLQGGRRISADFEPLLRRRLTLLGSTLRPLSKSEKSRIATTVTRTVLPLVARSIIRPHINQTFPLDRASDAHIWMESNANMGKIVLIP